MSSTSTTLDEWIFPADESEQQVDQESDDDWLDCGHSPEHADEEGQCVVCNVTRTTERGRDSMTDLTRDQATVSPFDGGGR